MKNPITKFGLLLILFCISTSVAAKPKPRIDIRVEEKKEPTLSTTSQAQVLRPAEMRRVADTVPKLLERAAGVHIKRYGGLDDFAQVSIRGSTTDQVLIYLDGILLNTAQGGVTDLSFLPLDQIERIEIYRGGSPGKVADSTPGGIILIITQGKPAATENLFRGSAGSFYTARGHLQRTQAIGDFFYNVSFDHFRSRGDFSFLDDRGTRANRNDDRIVHRQNNDFQTYDFTALAGSDKKEKLNWKIYENFFVKKQGIPGLGTNTSLASQLSTLRNFFHARLQPGAATSGRKAAASAGAEKKWSWNAHLFLDYLQSQFDDPLGEIGVGVQDNDDKTFRFGPEFHADTAWKNHFVSGFLAHRAEFFRPTDFRAANPHGPSSERHMISLGGEDEMVFWNEKLVLDPSARLQIFVNDWSDNHLTDTQLSAKLGIKLIAWQPLHFKTNLFRGFRQPTFSELFGDRGTLVGNSLLRAEEALNFDLGAGVHWEEMRWVNRFFLEAVYFHHDVENLIQFLQTSQFTAKAQNLNSAEIQGAELTATLQTFENFKVSGHYVFQSAKDDAQNSPTRGRTIPGRPRHQFFAETEYQYRWLKPFVEWNFLGHNYLDAQNLLRVNRRHLLAAGIQLTPWKKATISFATRNLLNSKIGDIAGFPLPGRSYWGEIKLNL